MPLALDNRAARSLKNSGRSALMQQECGSFGKLYFAGVYRDYDGQNPPRKLQFYWQAVIEACAQSRSPIIHDIGCASHASSGVHDGGSSRPPIIRRLDRDPTHLHKWPRQRWLDWAERRFEEEFWICDF